MNDTRLNWEDVSQLINESTKELSETVNQIISVDLSDRQNLITAIIGMQLQIRKVNFEYLKYKTLYEFADYCSEKMYNTGFLNPNIEKPTEAIRKAYAQGVASEATEESLFLSQVVTGIKLEMDSAKSFLADLELMLKTLPAPVDTEVKRKILNE